MQVEAGDLVDVAKSKIHPGVIINTRAAKVDIMFKVGEGDRHMGTARLVRYSIEEPAEGSTDSSMVKKGIHISNVGISSNIPV